MKRVPYIASMLPMLAAALAVCETAHAALLYSINTQTNELVTIDSTSGVVTPVGPIGHNVHDVDLAFQNDILFALNNDFGTRTELLAIDPATGSAFAAIPVRIGSTLITDAAEGLTSINGRLYASFDSTDTQTSPLTSNALALLDPVNGFLTQPFNYAIFDPKADLEGLAYRASDGQLFASRTTGSSGSLHEVDIDLPAYRTIGALPATNDLEFVADKLFALSEDGTVVYQVNANTGAIQSDTPLSAAGQPLSGLAIPEPSALGLLLVLGLALWRIRV